MRNEIWGCASGWSLGAVDRSISEKVKKCEVSLKLRLLLPSRPALLASGRLLQH